MKKTLLAMITLAITASSASAAGYIGGSIGSGATIHYQTDLSSGSAIRYGLNLTAVGFNFGTLSLGGGVDYLSNLSGQDFGGLNPYYGFGLDAGLGLGTYTGVSIYPHALLGLSYNVTTPLSVFGELNAGPNITVASSGTGIGFGFGARIGLNYQLP